MKQLVVSALLLAACVAPAPTDTNTNNNTTADTRTPPSPGPVEQRTHASSGASWTIMIYMVGDNDLEPFALDDVLEMAAVGSGNGLNILIQLDRHPDYANGALLGVPDFTGSKRFRVEQGSLTELQDMGEVNMASPQTLSDFIVWAKNTAPADRYAIVFWDHGGAWPGFGVDATSGGDLLTLPEIESALENGMGSAGITQFSLIGFDACLMAAVEGALTLRRFGEYYLASSEVEPGHGWDYRKLQLLKTTPSTAPIPFAQAMIDGFRAQAVAQNTDETVTLSLIDLYALDELRDGVALLAFQLEGKPVDNGVVYLGAAQRSLRFGDNPDPAAALHMVDLLDLATFVAADLPAAASAKQKIESGLTKAVLAKTAGAARLSSSGMTIYAPPPEHYKADYASLTAMAAWRHMITTFGGLDVQAPKFSDGRIVQWSTSSVIVEGTLASAAGIAEAQLYFGELDGQTLVLFGQAPAALAGVTVTGTWDGLYLVLQQGATASPGFFAASQENGYDVVSVPFCYKATASAQCQTAILYLAFQGGALATSTVYLVTSGLPGELKAPAGSTLTPILPVVSSDSLSWQSSGVSFDATQAFTFSTTGPVDPNNVRLVLEASSITGESDSLAFQRPPQ